MDVENVIKNGLDNAYGECGSDVRGQEQIATKAQ